MSVPSQLHIVLQLVIAGSLGAIIGLERESRERPAGLRTHVLVAVASALLLSLGRGLIGAETSLTAAIRADPLRVLQAVVTGISFIGAGTIIFHRGEDRLEGVTTAASILVTAAMGIAVALEMYVVAGLVALLVYGVLRSSIWLERPSADSQERDA